MNNIVIGDPHLDMYASKDETGHDWNLEIACERHLKAVLGLLKRAPAADTGMLTILGDSLHRDSLKALTPASGNLVDVSSRVSRAIKYATRLFRAMIIEMLKNHKKVVVVFVRGNHSETLELCLRDMLEIAFEKNKRVDVLENTSKHIPYSFGRNFLLCTHGDRLNDQKKADIAVSMFRDQHGAAKFTHVLSGHVHHSSVKEVSGCYIETFQALPTPDAWHTESGYVTSDQSVSMLTYHRQGGIVSRLNEYPRIYMD
jgi:UDP-2,3-diacylglucosamine pyrophosphatase LpxH